jgi:hypothetical protein
MIFIRDKQLQVAKNGLSSYSSVFYQATLEDSQLRCNNGTAAKVFNLVFTICKRALIYPFIKLLLRHN